MPDRLLMESIRTSESINCLTAFEETVFYRLIVSCDDQGIMDARPRILARTLFPLKDVRESQMQGALQALASAELVSFFEKEKKPFVRLTTWDKYQGGNKNIKPKKQPVKKEEAPVPESEIAFRIVLVAKDYDGNPTFHIITKQDITHYGSLFPGIDVEQEIRKMVAWCEANPARRKTKTGVKRFIVNWLARAQDRAPRMNYQPAPAAIDPPQPPANRGLEDWDDWKK